MRFYLPFKIIPALSTGLILLMLFNFKILACK
jgi:hypothetical protein